jgi:hypothetical protein
MLSVNAIIIGLRNEGPVDFLVQHSALHISYNPVLAPRVDEATVSAAAMEQRAKIKTGTPNTNGNAARGLSSPPPLAVLRSAARIE